MSRARYAALVAAFAALHAILAAWLPLSGDEAYYWDCSRNPDWSYFDQPPLVIWLMIPFRAVLGETALAVRAPAILASLVAGAMLVPLVRRLGGDVRHAAAAYALLHAMPIFFVGSFYASTDVAMATAWLGATWAAVALAQGDRRAWWGFGAACGLGFLAKFPIVLVAPALIPALRRAEIRRHLRTATPWLAALASLAITAPVWIWAARHDWANIEFQLSGRHTSGGGLSLAHLGAFAGTNLAIATPFLLVAMALAWWAWRRDPDPGKRAFRVAMATPFAFFGLVSVTKHVGGHWAGPGLLLGAAAIALVPIPFRRAWAVLGAVTGVALSLSIVAVAASPLWLIDAATGGGAPPPRKLARLFGNEEIAAEVVRRLHVGETLASESYTDVHLFAFLSGGGLPTALADVGGGKHGLASLYWHGADRWRGGNFLVVGEREGFDERIVPLFRDCAEDDPIDVVREGRLLRRVRVLRCRELLEPYPAFSRVP